MSEYEEAEEVMKRIEEAAGTKSGKMLVKGTMLLKGDEMIRTSFDNTTSEALKKYICDQMKDLCNYFVREQNPLDKVEFVRVDYKEKLSRDNRYQVDLAVEGDLHAVVVQEYKVRDLRVRPKEQKDIKGYLHVQKYFFFPTLDK